MPIHLPPLRDRADDIDPLVQYFLKQFNQKLKKDIRGLAPETMAALHRQTRYISYISQISCSDNNERALFSFYTIIAAVQGNII